MNNARFRALQVAGGTLTALSTLRRLEREYNWIKKHFATPRRRRTTPIMPSRILSRRGRKARTSLGKRKRRISRKRANRVKTKRQLPTDNYRKRYSKKKPRANAHSELNRLLGPPPGYQALTRKSMYEITTFANQNTLTLHSRPLIRIAHSGNTENMAFRHGNACLIRGVLVTFKFKILQAYVGQPLRFHWAIVANREVMQPADSNFNLSTVDFFETIEPNELNDDAQNFITSDSCIKLEKRRINPMLYLTLKRGSFTLEHNAATMYNPNSGPPQTTVVSGNVTGSENQAGLYKTVRQYIPLNTQMRFDTDADTYPVDKNIYFCWWAFPMDKESSATTPVEAYKEMHNYITYFEDSTP